MSFLRGWCKKNLQPFPKSFFFFSPPREKSVESLRGFYGLLSPSLSPFPVSFHFYFFLLEDKAWLVENLVLPRSVPSVVRAADLCPLPPAFHLPPSGP